MTISECMKRMSYKEYLVRKRWHQLEWNNPSRTDHYLMRLAQVVQQVNVKNPQRIKLPDQKIKFGKDNDQKKPAASAVISGMTRKVGGGAVRRNGNRARN